MKCHVSRKVPCCGVIWSEIANGQWDVRESDFQSQAHLAARLGIFDPSSGKLLSEYQLALNVASTEAIGADNGLLYIQITIPHQSIAAPYNDFALAAYRFTAGKMVWRFDLPPFPTPASANPAPGTSNTVLAP